MGEYRIQFQECGKSRWFRENIIHFEDGKSDQVISSTEPLKVYSAGLCKECLGKEVFEDIQGIQKARGVHFPVRIVQWMKNKLSKKVNMQMERRKNLKVSGKWLFAASRLDKEVEGLKSAKAFEEEIKELEEGVRETLVSEAYDKLEAELVEARDALLPSKKDV